MDENEKILLDNFKEYFELAEEALKRKKYNSATTLFFKSFVSLCDLHILRNEGKTPSSHSDRFRILEENHPEIYKMADRDFPFYQDSYNHKMTDEAAKLLKEDALSIKKMLGI